MILIGGTELGLEELPFSDMMEYTLENNPSILSIKLKTVARGSTCLGVYLHTDLNTFELSPEVLEKTKFFSNDDQLIKYLESGGQEEEVQQPIHMDAQQEQSHEEDVKVFDAPPAPVAGSSLSASVKDTVVIEEVDTDLPDMLLSIPIIGDDTDNLKVQLETKQRIIDQKDGLLLEAKQSIDELYKLQEIQLLEMREAYERRINEVNAVIEVLQKQVNESAVPEELQWFLKYATYSQNFKASLREGFTEEDFASLGKLSSQVYIFASGAGDSLHNMMKNVKSLMDTNPNALVVDFSNDYFMNARYRIQSRESSMLLNDDNFEVVNLVKEVQGVRLIPTTFYNDISLLGIDWVKVLKKLNQYAMGRPLILLFNNINSFSVRYTVSKLATVGQLFIFAKCNPVILSTLFGDIAFIPENRFKVVAMEYIDIVQAVLEQISKKYQVVAFKESVNWSKLGVRV